MIDGPLDSLLGGNSDGRGCGTTILIFFGSLVVLVAIMVLISWLFGK